MKYRTPRLEIFPNRIKENAKIIIDLCRSHDAQIACVTKVASAHLGVTRALYESGPDGIADSRISNLRYMGELGVMLPRLLLRMPSKSEISDVVNDCEISLNSSLSTLRRLSGESIMQGVRHKVIIMVDVGDLREGVWPDNAPGLLKEAGKLKGIEIIGLGCNLACYGGVKPSVSNMNLLVEVRDYCRKTTGMELGLLSGGNSANLELLASGKMPKEINHFRIGEAIILGRNTLDRSPWPGTRQDTFRIVAEVIEVERKPSVPIGEICLDAFGQKPVFEDRGVRKRAICVIGRQDVVVDDITPIDCGIKVLGGSSDHLIIDIEDAAENIAVGDEVAFYPAYGSLLALSTSPYVSKIVIED